MFEASTSQQFREELERKKQMLMRIKNAQREQLNNSRSEVQSQASAARGSSGQVQVAATTTLSQEASSRTYNKKNESITAYVVTVENSQRPATSYIQTQASIDSRRQSVENIICNKETPQYAINPLSTIQNQYGRTSGDLGSKPESRARSDLSADSRNISPQRQNFLVGREQQTGSSYELIDTKYSDQEMGKFVPIKPSAAMSPIEDTAALTTAQPTSKSHHMLPHDPSIGFIHQSQTQSSQRQTLVSQSAAMKIQEPPSHHSQSQEISSIMQKQQQTTTLHQDDSAFAYTSLGKSPVEDSTNRFVFNTRALEGSEQKQPGPMAEHLYHMMEQRQQERGNEDSVQYMQTTNTFNGDLSEPVIVTKQRAVAGLHQRHHHKAGSMESRNTTSTKLQQQVQDLMSREPPLTSIHQGGGSFGNADDFEGTIQCLINTRKEQSRTNSSNSFVKLERMLQDQAYQMKADQRRNHHRQASAAQNTAPQQIRVTYHGGGNQDLKESTDHSKKTSVDLNAKINYNDDSSVDFHKRKYDTKNLKVAPRQPSRESQNSIHRKTQSVDNQPRQKARTSYNTKEASRLSSRESDLSKSPERPNAQDNSQVSISQLSRDSYGRYFIRSRSFNKQKDEKRTQVNSSNGGNTLNDRKLSIDGKRQSRQSNQRSQKSNRKTEKSRITSGSHSRSQKRPRRVKDSKKESHSLSRAQEIVLLSKKIVRKSGDRKKKIQNSTDQNENPSRQQITRNLRQLTSLSRSRSATKHSLQTMNTLPAMKITTQGRPPKHHTSIPNPFSTLPAKEKLSMVAKSQLATSREKNMTPKNGVSYGTTRAQLAVELQKSQASLIKCQSKLEKVKQESKDRNRDLRRVIADQDQCIRMLEQKNSKLEAKLSKANGRLDQLTQKLGETRDLGQQQIQALQTQLNGLRQRMERDAAEFTEEKKGIIINMEREIQSTNNQLQHHFGVKIQTLQNLNTQLNSRLQQFDGLRVDFDNLQQEYNNSLEVINEQTNVINEQTKMITAHTQELNDQAEEVFHLQEALHEKENAITQSMQVIEEHAVALKELESLREEHERTIHDMDLRLGHQNSAIQHLKLQLEGLQSENKQLVRQRVEAEHQVKVLINELEEVKIREEKKRSKGPKVAEFKIQTGEGEEIKIIAQGAGLELIKVIRRNQEGEKEVKVIRCDQKDERVYTALEGTKPPQNNNLVDVKARIARLMGSSQSSQSQALEGRSLNSVDDNYESMTINDFSQRSRWKE